MPEKESVIEGLLSLKSFSFIGQMQLISYILSGSTTFVIVYKSLQILWMLLKCLRCVELVLFYCFLFAFRLKNVYLHTPLWVFGMCLLALSCMLQK